jgi:hypothetical protein
MKITLSLCSLLSFNLVAQEAESPLMTTEVERLAFQISYSNKTEAVVFFEAFRQMLGERFLNQTLLKDEAMEKLCLAFEKLVELKPVVADMNDLDAKALAATRLISPQLYFAMNNGSSSVRPCKALFVFLKSLQDELKELKRMGIVPPETLELFSGAIFKPLNMTPEEKRQFDLNQAKESLIRSAEVRANLLFREVEHVTDDLRRFLRLLKMQNPDDFARVKAASGMTEEEFEALVGPVEK